LEQHDAIQERVGSDSCIYFLLCEAVEAELPADAVGIAGHDEG
jgi:hypothetical protein